ncbi:oxidoreductase [Peterkaempfera bronchialis]|uniref:oxidoreductase n=1 Tax=Peterkaempfera bronchialis TaxID=2126346 RepID=UPI003C2BE33D
MAEPPEGWSEPECRLWEAYRRGEVLDLRVGVPEDDHPVTGGAWGPERTVRAGVLAHLLLDGPPSEPGRVASLKLTGAYVTGGLDLAGGEVSAYVELRGCRFERKVLMSECRAGTVRLVGCLIPRLEASRLVTEGDLHLPRSVLTGGLRLTDARIGTDLLLNQATVGGDRNGRAIAADGLTVSQDLEAELIRCTGEISLRSARIGGRLSLRGSSLRVRSGRLCLNAARISVEHTLYLSRCWLTGWTASGSDYGSGYGERPTEPAEPSASVPFRARGGVRLDDGRFGNACLIDQAEFLLGPDQELSLRRIQTPELRFCLSRTPTGRVSLSRARVGNLIDAPESWPGGGRVGLTGFTYESLRPAAGFPLEKRIAWLDNALGEFRPEPYEQLAAALRRDGLDEDARAVQLAKHRRRRAALPPLGRVWGRLQDITVGYGYRPARAALWMALVWALGAAWFAGHPPQPLKPDEAPHWNAALYAMDLLLPLIDLGQDSAWKPSGADQWAATALILLGWVLATTVAAGATRLLRRG